MDDKIEVMSNFIKHTLHIPVMIWDNRIETLKEFGKVHIFFKNSKSIYSPDELAILLKNIKYFEAHELHDASGTTIIIFKVYDTPMLVGPFVTTKWDELFDEKKFGDSSLALSHRFHFNSYSEGNAEQIVNVINSSYISLFQKEGKYIHRTIKELEISSYEDLDFKEYNNYLIQMNLSRYENELLTLVSEGLVSEVIPALNKFKTTYINSKSVDFISSIDDTIIFSVLVATMIRKVAENSGVHPVMLNSIIQSYTKNIRNCSTIDRIDKYLQEYVISITEMVQSKQQESYSKPIRESIDYIKIKFNEQLTLCEISNKVHISPSHLSRTFKEEVGVTIFTYIRLIRLHAAKELLKTSTLTIMDIGAYVGYNDNSHFSKIFKEKYAKTPTEFRNLWCTKK